MLLNPFAYIDIHTHQSIDEQDVFVIRNQILGIDPPETRWFSAGIHPWYLEEAITNQLFKEITANEKCILIGEIGLDKLTHTDFSLQTAFFIKQIEWAEELKKPVIIHCVKAFQEVLKFHQEKQPTVPWILHGFNKKPELAKQLLAKGLYLSFGSHIITHPTVQLALKETPIDRLFFETDDQTDYSIQQIYEAASNQLNINLEDLQQHIKNNFKTLLQKCKT